MFDYLFLNSAIESLQKLPKEFVYAAFACVTVTEVHKRRAQVQTSKIAADAKVRIAELEVEQLRLQLDLHNARAETPPR